MIKKSYKQKLIFMIIIITIFSIIIVVNSNAMAQEENNLEFINSIRPCKDIVKQAVSSDYEDKPYTEEYIKWLNSSEEEKRKYGDIVPAKEFIAIHNNSEIQVMDSENKNLEINSLGTTNLKDNVSSNLMVNIGNSYMLTNLRVENQESSGWCGIYSSLKCLETYLYKKKNVNYNLAEYHMAYMSMKEFGGWIDYSLEMKENNWPNLGVTKWHHGNNFEDFMIYSGFRDIRTDLYSKYSYDIKGPITGKNSENGIYSVNDANISNFKNKKPEVKVKSVISFSSIEKKYSQDTISYYNGNKKLENSVVNEFRNTVKSHIKDKGAVWTCTNVDEKYFNNSTSALYINNNDIKSNHAVCIVGWDDNYSKDNFLYGKRPKNNGAWIALNSWGDSWGTNGFYYISYDDALVEKWMFAVNDAELANEKPKAEINYYKNSNNTITVEIKSTDKINNIYAWKDNDWKIDNNWKKNYIRGNSNNKYYTEYTKDTIFTKTFNKNTKEYIQLQNELGNYLDKYLIINVTDIDNSGPSISSVTGYKNNIWQKGDVTITVRATDNTAIDTFGYSFDGGRTWQNTNYKTFKETRKDVKIVVRDKFENKTTYKETINVLIDKTIPTLSIIANEGVSGTKWVSPVANKTSHLKVSAQDTGGSGIVYGYEYSFDNKNWKLHNTKDSQNSYFNYYFTKNETVYFRVKDNAGNVSKTAVAKITMIDKDGPKIESIKPNISNDNSNVTLTINATDTQSGLATSAYSFDGGKTWQKGNQKIYYSNQTISKNSIKVKDLTGNITTYSNDIIINQINTIKLQITSTEYSPKLITYTNENVVVKVTVNKKSKTNNPGWNVSKDGKTFTKTYSSNTTQGGEKLFITDASTNFTIDTIIKIQNIDKNIPVLQGKITRSSNEKYVQSVKLTIPSNAVKDIGFGLNSKPYSYDGGKTWTSNNSNTYYQNGKKTILVRDKALNVLTIYEDIDNIDREKPVINSVKGIKTGWSKDDITLEIDATDNNGKNGLQYSFDNGASWSTSNKKTYSKTTNGIIIKVKDKAGWIVTYKNGLKINLNIDKQIPTITTSSKKGITEWAKNGDYLDMQIKDTGGSGIQEILWYREKGTTTWKKNSSKDGAYNHFYIEKAYTGKTLELMVKDKAINYSKILEVKLQKIDFDGPKINGIEKNGVNVIVKAEDLGSGIKEYYDGNKWNIWPNGSKEVTLSFKENTTITAGTIKLKDNLGNISSYNKEIKIGIITKFSAKVNYSIANLTNKDVKVTITANKEIKDIPSGWQKLTNGIQIVKNYTNNTENQGETIKLDAKETGEIFNANVKITNIDKILPTININGNPENWVKEAVIEVDAKDASGILGYSFNEGKYKEQNTYSVTKNEEIKVKVKDKAGNIAEKIVTVNKIDDRLPQIISVGKPKYAEDKSKATVEINAKDDETGLGKYFDGKTWKDWPEGKDKIELEFSDNAVIKAGTIKIKDKAENEISYNKSIIVNGIDKKELELEQIEYSTKELTNKDVIVTVRANKEILEPDGWTYVENDKKAITKTYSENTQGEGEILSLQDANTKKIITIEEKIKVENIDKIAPIISKEDITYEVMANSHVKAVVKANEEILPITNTKNGLGVKWSLDENNKKIISAEFSANKRGNIIVKDKAGNTACVSIEINIPDLPESLNAEIMYKEIIGQEEKDINNDVFTKNNVKVIINVSREINEVENWILSNDKKSIEKIFENYVEDEKITLVDRNNNNYKEEVLISLKIDKKAPRITNITGNPENWKQKAVIKVIAEDENGISGYSFNGENYVSKNAYTVKNNGLVTVRVKDKAGNESEIQNIEVTKLDNKAPIIKNITKTISIDKQKVSLTIDAVDDGDSGIKEYSFDGGITWQNENLYDYDCNQTIDSGAIKVKDNTGNITTYSEPILIEEIDNSNLKVIKTKYSTLDFTNGNVEVTIITNKEIEEVDGWELSNDKKSITKIFSENTTDSGEIVILTDLNTRRKISKSIIISNIDKVAPNGNITYNKLSNKEVKVTIKANEKIQELDGWELEDENTLTKIYTENTNLNGENVVIKDLAGNEKVLTIKIDSIKQDVGINVDMIYSTKDVTNKSVKVQIKADRKVTIDDKYKELNWKLLEDEKTLEKIFDENCTEMIELIDLDDLDNKESVYVCVDNIDKQETKIITIYEELEDGKINVILRSNREIKEKENWELSESKLELSRIYEKDAEETVIVKDIFDQEYEIQIKVVIKKSEEDNEEELENEYDIDGNGTIDVADVLILKRIIVSGEDDNSKINEEIKESADINKDGKINVIDLLLLKRKLLKR